MMEVNLRLMQTSDYEELLKLVIVTWDYRSWVQPELVYPMAEFFLSDLLQRSDHIVIATVDGTLAGVCAGDIIDLTKLQSFSRRQKLKALGEILQQTEKDSIFEKYIQTLALDEVLLRESKHEFPASLNLLIVKEEYQGLGIGSKLYRDFCQYLKNNDVHSFYLYTDDSSDYRFYEHQKMEKLAQKDFYWKPKQRAERETYFIYGKYS